MTMEAETGVMRPPVKNFRQPLDLEKARNTFSPKASKESTALPTPGFPPSDMAFKLLAGATVREYLSVLSQQVCGSYGSIGN